MKYNQLRNSDLKVSEISFGCMSLGEDHAENAKLLHRAFDLGINCFDTADLYQKGWNEKTVGKALKDRRKQVIIATKVGNQLRADGSGWDWNPRKNYIKKAVQESLRRLQTDYIDLYQLHGGTLEDPITESIEAFEELKEAGLIRAYGISSIRPNVIREWIKRSNISSVMMQYSLLDRRPEESCLDLLKENNISVIVRGAVAKGLLAGKEAKSYLNHSTEEVAKAQELLNTMLAKNASSGQVAMQYVLKHPAIATIAAGIRTMEQLEENINSVNIEQLDVTKLEQLKNGVKTYFYEKHR